MVFLIDWDTGQPLYTQIRDQVVIGIATGEIHPGDSLPSIRSLAEELAINLHTVHKAYQILDQEGYIHLSRRDGGRVRPLTKASQEFAHAWEQRLLTVLAEARAQGMTPQEMFNHCEQHLNSFDNSSASPNEGGISS